LLHDEVAPEFFQSGPSGSVRRIVHIVSFMVISAASGNIFVQSVSTQLMGSCAASGAMMFEAC